MGRPFFSMGTDYEYLHQWLDRVAPGSFATLDTEYILIRKLLEHYSGTPNRDPYWALVRKLASATGATPEHSDTEFNLWFKIAGALSADPRRGDTQNILLRKIAAL